MTIAGCVFPVGGCCCTKVFSELRGALIGVEVEIGGGPDWVAVGAVLMVQTDSEVIGVGSVLTAEVEVEQWIQEVRLKVDVDGVRALKVAMGMAVDMFAQLPCLLGRQFTLIRAANREKRYRWALENLGAGFDDVIWSDETSVQMEPHRRFCCRKKGQKP